MVNSDTPIQLNSLSWDSVSQRQMTAGNRVYQALKDAIVQLQLRPGNALRETEISKQLGVSRQPVREAFFKLADVGLVEIQPQRGTFVQLISRKAVENARFIREAVEVAVVRKAALEASDASIAAIKTHLIEQERASMRRLPIVSTAITPGALSRNSRCRWTGCVSSACRRQRP